MLDGEEFDALVADIKANGLRVPITIFDGKILDGRNRYRACQAAGVKPRFEKFSGTETDALGFVLSLNLSRRHLTTPQRAALALRFLAVERELARGRMLSGKRAGPPKDPGEGSSANGEATERAGARVGLSGETVRQAAKIATRAPDVLAAMADGTIRSVPEGVSLAAMLEKDREVVLKRMGPGGVRRAVTLGG
ncbi:MAG: ParB N-terminal domain-containing protein [Myxococcota bacterium]